MSQLINEQLTHLHEVQVFTFEVKLYFCTANFIGYIIVLSDTVEEGMQDGLVQSKSKERIKL